MADRRWLFGTSTRWQGPRRGADRKGVQRMSTVRIDDRSAGVRWLTLNRPPANAENEALLGDLLVAVEQAGADPTVRAVLLTGAGKFFSGGFDLSPPRRDGEEVVVMTTLFRDVHLRLLTLPKP